MTYFKPEPKPVKPLETVLDAVLDREGWETMPVTTDALDLLASTFAKPRTKATKPTTTVDNNGWGKKWEPEELARVTIDSDLSPRGSRKGLTAKEARSKSKKG